jgi:hypothetical protein
MRAVVDLGKKLSGQDFLGLTAISPVMQCGDWYVPSVTPYHNGLVIPDSSKLATLTVLCEASSR